MLSKSVEYVDNDPAMPERVFEIEYIIYDATVDQGEQPQFGKHKDNDSLVTMVLMMSLESEWEGGYNSRRALPRS